jgi:cytochrome P450
MSGGPSTDDAVGRTFAEAASYANQDRWHEMAARTRAEQPILHVVLPEYPEFWAITKHADVMEIERHPEVFTNAPIPVLVNRAQLRATASQGSGAVKALTQMDGAEHRAHRNIVNDWFKPGSVKQMQTRIDELARGSVDRMASLGGTCDFARDIAVHYPLQAILSILGMPESEHDRMLTLTQELFGAEDPDIGRAGQDSSVLEVMFDFMTYFRELAEARRATPTGDLASLVANAELDGAPLPDLDVFSLYLIVATAGHDTTSNSISGGLLALLEQRDQLDLLQAQPDLIGRGADELIRWVSPVKHFMRTCRAEFTVRDVTFQPGQLVMLSFASANRDEDVFVDPFRLDVRRENAAAHLGFGFGHHFCLGAHLARMEIRAFFTELLARLEWIELTGDPTFVHSSLVTGPKTLPIRFALR